MLELAILQVTDFYTTQVTVLLADLEERAKEKWQMLQHRFDTCNEDYSYLIDAGRAHDNWVLQWVTQLGFDRLYTDFAPLAHNQKLSAATEPTSKLDIVQAKKGWTDFMTGQVKLDTLMQACKEGHGICMVSPEGSMWTHASVRIIQDNFLMMLKTGKPYKLCFLMNVHRFPVDGNNMQQVYFGLQLYQNMLLDMHMWPFIDSIQVIQQLKPGQFSIGSGWQQPLHVVRNSHYMVAICTSDNRNAQELMKAMNTGTMSPSDNSVFIGWGHHRVERSHAKKCFNDGTDLRHNTWEFCKVPFPQVQLLADTSHKPMELKLKGCAVEGRLSMDILEGRLTKKDMSALIASYKVPERLADTTDVFIDPNSRKSYGNWHKDRWTAWDITISGRVEWDKETMRLNTYRIALSIWTRWAEWKPLIGYKAMLNLRPGKQWPHLLHGGIQLHGGPASAHR